MAKYFAIRGIVNLEREATANPLARVRSLHTHFDQDGFGPDVPAPANIIYVIKWTKKQR